MHFGIKTNNLTWLELQKKFVEQIIDKSIDGHDRVVFLGDLFDIRYSVNTLVGCEVKKLVRRLLNKHRDVQFVFVAGNHDYYSPVIDFEEYNAYELAFGEEFVEAYPNMQIVSSLPLLKDRTLFLPWYFTEDDARYEATMKEYRGQFDIVYCHTDCEHWSDAKAALKGDATVYSGHIHYPYVNIENRLFNLGAACAFTFNDVNSHRFLYTIENGKITDKIENDVTPRFSRFYNDRIFDLTETDLTNSITQLCISKDNLQKARFKEQIKYLKMTYTGCDIRVIEIDESMSDMYTGDTIDFNTNIHEYIRQNTPDHLSSKLDILTERLL